MTETLFPLRRFVDTAAALAEVPLKFVRPIVGDKPVEVAKTLMELPGRMVVTGADVTLNALSEIGKRPALVPVQANSPAFAEGLFRDSREWKPMLHEQDVASRYRIMSGDKIFAESRFMIRASDGVEATMDRLIDRLRNPWNFYRGAVKNWTKHTDGRVTYDLEPTGFGLKVAETMGMPLRMRDGRVRIPIMLERDAHGLAYLEIVPRPDRGGVELIGRFAGVQPGGLGNGFGAEDYARNHLLAEGGRASRIPGLGHFLNDGGGLYGIVREFGALPVD